jgi:hypothetical protein
VGSVTDGIRFVWRQPALVGVAAAALGPRIRAVT